MVKPVLYTTPSCGQCRMVKRWLDKNDVSFIEVEATQPSIVRYLKELGFSQAPVLEVGDKMWQGFDVGKMEEFILN